MWNWQQTSPPYPSPPAGTQSVSSLSPLVPSDILTGGGFIVTANYFYLATLYGGGDVDKAFTTPASIMWSAYGSLPVTKVTQSGAYWVPQGDTVSGNAPLTNKNPIGYSSAGVLIVGLRNPSGGYDCVITSCAVADINPLTWGFSRRFVSGVTSGTIGAFTAGCNYYGTASSPTGVVNHRHAWDSFAGASAVSTATAQAFYARASSVSTAAVVEAFRVARAPDASASAEASAVLLPAGIDATSTGDTDLIGGTNLNGFLSRAYARVGGLSDKFGDLFFFLEPWR